MLNPTLYNALSKCWQKFGFLWFRTFDIKDLRTKPLNELAALGYLDKQPQGAGKNYRWRITKKALKLMQTKVIYLAGPMKGIAHFNFPAFDQASTMLRERGHRVFSPAEFTHDTQRDNPEGCEVKAAAHGFNRREAIKHELIWICDNADAIAMLPGWENSTGACAEKALAEAIGIEVFYL